ncbi:MAG: PEGA domain-containing protein [bacterium]|nr:PEGA domain-containing protein [bacterium]
MVPFLVQSSPSGGQVDVNGVDLGRTPVHIQLQCSKRWVGVAVAPGGWAYDQAFYQVTVYPPRGHSGTTQTKRVNACQVKTPPGKLSFDLQLVPALSFPTVPRVHRRSSCREVQFVGPRPFLGNHGENVVVRDGADVELWEVATYDWEFLHLYPYWAKICETSEGTFLLVDDEQLLVIRQ